MRNAELSRSYSSPIRRSASTRTAPTAATDARGFNHTRYASLKRINTSPVPPGELMRTLSDSRSRPFKTASPPPSSYSPPVPRDMKRRGTLLTRSPLQQTYTSAGEGARRIVRRPTGRSMRTPELDEDTSSSASSSDAGFPSTRIMVKVTNFP